MKGTRRRGRLLSERARDGGFGLEWLKPRRPRSYRESFEVGKEAPKGREGVDNFSGESENFSGVLLAGGGISWGRKTRKSMREPSEGRMGELGKG